MAIGPLMEPRRGFAAPPAALILFLLLCVLSTGEGRAQQTPPQVGTATLVVDSIEVVGNYRLAAPTIIGTLGFQVGSEVTWREIQRAVKNLYGTAQFEDVRVSVRGVEGEPVLLVLNVRERPLVRRVTIRGLEHANESTVRDTARLQPGFPYSPPRVAAAKEFIRSELADEGIPFARIEERVEEVEGTPGEIFLYLDVTEGNRVTVADLDIQGNDAVSDAQIRDAMNTKPEGFFWFRNGSYDLETFRQDLEERIPDVYAARGYLDFQILGDTLVVDPQTGKSRLELQVFEGPRYRLGGFEVRGNRQFSSEEVQQYFRPEEGGLLRSLGIGRGETASDGTPFFNALAFERAREQLVQAYNNEGYIYAEVEPWIEVQDSLEGHPVVQVGWRITENNPAYVNRVDVVGNEFTHERVIREKIFILPGDVYSMDRVISSYQSIQSLGFFETPMPNPDIRPDPETGDVDITFEVEERQTGSINFGTAVGGGTGVSGFLGYDQPNLFGQAKQGHLRWDFGRYINSFTLTYSDPSLLQSQVSGTFSVYNSRDRFFQFRTGRRKRVGFSTQFGFPIPWSLRTRLFVGYSLSRTEYKLYQDVDDTSLFGLPPGTQSTLSMGLTRSTLNHPLFPTQGSRQSWNTEFNGGLLGGDGTFIRHMADASWWVPVGQLGGGAPGSRGILLALGLTMRGGAIFGNVNRFPFDRFWMGGVQFGQQLRGYDETSITPLGYFPEGSGQLSDIQRLGNAFFSTTAEYRVRMNDNLSVSLFMDAGNVWSDPVYFDPSRLYRGAGLGVQLVTPFGPIGLDYAYGFDKVNPGWQLHFRMGAGY